jgi:RimJ/RimL family protein N-acetyltransferase
VQLTDDRLLLRPPKMSDADALFEAARESIAALATWLPWCHPNYQREESVGWIRLCRTGWDEGTAFQFFIFARDTLGFLGSCGINEYDQPRRRANLGYWVRSRAQRTGVATAAARLAARFAFNELGMQRLEIVAAVGNVASQRVAARLGATCEGCLRNRLRIGQVQHDAFGYSLIPGDAAQWKVNDRESNLAASLAMRGAIPAPK